MLDSIETEDKRPLTATFHFHRGQVQIARQNWRQAETVLHQAIHFASTANVKSNIEAAAFQALGYVHYQQNDLERALKFTESGLAAYDSQGERTQVYFGLQRNKAIYLERLGRVAESMRLVQDIWDQLPQCTDTEAKLTFYWLRAELSRRLGMYEEALDYAYAGEDLARQNKSHFSMFTFWTVLGDVYMHMDQLEQAESCFQTALSLRDQLNGTQQKSLNTAYARFAILQMQQDRVSEALELIEQAIESAKEHQDEPRLVQSLTIKGNILKARMRESRNPCNSCDRCFPELFSEAIRIDHFPCSRRSFSSLRFFTSSSMYLGI